MTTYQCPACCGILRDQNPPEWFACPDCGCVMSAQYAKIAEEKYAHIATCDDDCKNPSCLDQNECEHEYKKSSSGYSSCIKCSVGKKSAEEEAGMKYQEEGEKVYDYLVRLCSKETVVPEPKECEHDFGLLFSLNRFTSCSKCGKAYQQSSEDFDKEIRDKIAEKRAAEKTEPTISNKEEWPKEGVYYFYLDCGHIRETKWWNLDNDKGCKAIGNIHRTKEDAENYRLRLESLAVKQTYIGADSIWVWNFAEEKARETFDALLWATQPKFATESEAVEWGERFSKAWIEWNNPQ